MFPAVVIFLLLGNTASQVTCPSVTCGTLADANVCAEKMSSGVTVNSQLCGTGLACSVAGLLSWWREGTSAQLQCTVFTPVANTTGTTCQTRVQSKSFKSGTALVFCEKDEDCLLEDLTYTAGSCQCTLRADSRAVCQPDPSNAVYREYWDDCGDSNAMEDEKEFAYWTYYMQVWALTQTNITCVDNLREFQTLESLYNAYVSVAGALGGALVLAVTWL